NWRLQATGHGPTYGWPRPPVWPEALQGISRTQFKYGAGKAPGIVPLK
uniref:Uncharacterized protein n=1 Tax=Aquila chrysaetos chrysaetos TaxID=223781 RepID=A0A663DKS8_AQUCH